VDGRQSQLPQTQAEPGAPEPLRYAFEEVVREGFHCPSCNRDIVTAVAGVFAYPKVGSPQRFCSASCRQAAYRRRKAGVAESTPGQFKGGRRRRLKTADEKAPAQQPHEGPAVQ
jgi:hypothetical protein